MIIGSILFAIVGYLLVRHWERKDKRDRERKQNDLYNDQNWFK